MNTIIRTSGYFYKGLDRIDITVAYAEKNPEYVGSCLAPTWNMVGGIKHWIYANEVQELRWENLTGTEEYKLAFERLTRWSKVPQLSELGYAEEYRKLMRSRFHSMRNKFEQIASMDQVTMVCYCAGVHTGKFCHRTLAIEYVHAVAKAIGRTPIVVGEV